MLEELVDIVDSNNQIIGQTTKLEAHQKGLLHRIIIAELINSKGEWILVKQAADRQDPGQLVSPVGGHIQAGESELSALKREAQEEVGLIDFNYKYIGKAIYHREVLNRIENHYFILYEIYSNQAVTLNHESVAHQNITPKQLRHQLRKDPDKFGAAFHFVIQEFYPKLTSNRIK